MKFFKNIALVFRQEWRLMLRDPGLLLFFIGLPLLYPLVYTLIYNPEVVRDVPVAVVDDCRTPESRELVRQASAAPAFKLYDYCANMADARDLWGQQKVYAILHIPSYYSQDIARAEQAHATLYCDMSLLMRYRSLMAAMTSLQLELASEITAQRVEESGMASSGLGGAPIGAVSHFLGDTQQGFASFVIPGIVVLILQQSLVLGAGLMGGTARERRRRNGGIDPLGISQASTWASVIGCALAYTVFYIPLTIYILIVVPEIFNLPHVGDGWQALAFIFPMLLASSFMGQAIVVFIKEREYVFPVIVFSSVIFLFLSGLTWPRYAMNPFWWLVGSAVPATWGVEGFIRINSNGATLAENAIPYLCLWGLAAFYCVLSALALRHVRRRARQLSRPSI